MASKRSCDCRKCKSRFCASGLAIVGFGDFTWAGRQDVLWRNTLDGSVDAWIMNGFTIVAQWFPATVSPDWQIRATPEVNGNGVNDILWSNIITGQQVIWTPNGSTFVPAGPFATAAPAWVVQPQVSFAKFRQSPNLYPNRRRTLAPFCGLRKMYFRPVSLDDTYSFTTILLRVV